MPSTVQAYARIGGILFLASVVAGGFGEFIAPSQIIAPGDAAATAHHVVGAGSLFRLGFAAYLIETACDTALTAVFYVLLRPVSRFLALVVVFFRIMATATFAFAEVFYFAPAFILGSDHYLKSFTPDQLATLALLSLNVYGFAGTFSQLYYGVASVGIGYLIFQSGFLPRPIGVAWVIAGLCFVLEILVVVLAPSYDTPLLALPTILAVLMLTAWWLVKGVDVSRWEARAGRPLPAAAT